MRLDVVTIFPDYLAPLDLSLIGKARRDGLIDLRVHDLREFTHDRHRTVDDTPYGGGAGMVMKPQPWSEALDHVAGEGSSRPTLVIPGPGGEVFTQETARELAQRDWLVFGCGRYEGIDERVYDYAADAYDVRVVSLGDYVLNGGEVAVLAMVEAIARLLPGVIGNADSLVEESHEDGLLEYPVYTKPADWHGRPVPDVLLSGDHGKVAAWRHQQRLERTAARRPDLLHASAGFSVAGLEEGEWRPATRGDVGELLTLTHACWLREVIDNEALDIPAAHETYDSVAASLDEWDTRVLRVAGRLVGSLRTRTEGDTCYVGRLMVAPDLRGRGLGRWLLGQVEVLAPSSVAGYELHTGVKSVGNRRMYAKAGYRPVPSEIEGTVRMRKRVRR